MKMRILFLTAVLFISGYGMVNAEETVPEREVVVSDVSPESHFYLGNQFFEEKKYEDASKQYHKALETEGEASEIYFNLGNTALKQGSIGRAKVFYLRALRLSPRDEKIRANLVFVNGLLEYKVETKQNFFQEQLQRIAEKHSKLEAAFILASMIAVFLFTLLLRILFQQSGFYRFLNSLSFLALILIFALILSEKFLLLPGKPAVIISNESVLRYGPSEQDNKILKLVEGLDVFIAEHRESWSRVELSNGETGWIPNESFEAV